MNGTKLGTAEISHYDTGPARATSPAGSELCLLAKLESACQLSVIFVQKLRAVEAMLGISRPEAPEKNSGPKSGGAYALLSDLNELFNKQAEALQNIEKAIGG